ncbi:MAG: ABC transporter substrate-binding protein [Holophagales bacterium]|nr:ABC transporter substrate-binding protein [Holophagales bacterium]
MSRRIPARGVDAGTDLGRRQLLRACGRLGVGAAWAGSLGGLWGALGIGPGGDLWAQEQGEAETGPSNPFGEPVAGPAGDVPGLDYVEVRFGMSAPFSGPEASAGVEYLRGALTWLNHLNGRGGVHGRRVALLAQDDGGRAIRALRNTADFLAGGGEEDTGVFGLFAFSGTEPLLRTLPVLHGHPEVILLAPRSPAHAPRQQPWAEQIFFLGPSSTAYLAVALPHLLGTGARRLGLHAPLDAGGRDAAQALRKILARLAPVPNSADSPSSDPELVVETTHRPTSTTARSLAEAADLLRRSGVEALVFSGASTAGIELLTNLAAAGWRGSVLLGPSVDGEAVLAALAEADLLGQLGELYHARPVPVLDPDSAHGAPAGQDPTDEGSPQQANTPTAAVGEYLELFRRRPPRVPEALLEPDYRPRGPSSIGLEGFLAARVLAEALDRAGPYPDRTSFRAALESMGDYDPGLGRNLGFGPGIHRGPEAVFVARAEGDRFLPISNGASTA